MTKTQVYPAPLYEKKSRQDIFLHVFCKFLMRENGFTASNICKQTRLWHCSMGKKTSYPQLFVREDKSIIKHFIDLKHEINN